MFRRFLKPQVFATGAYGQSGGVRDPVEPALFPRLPTFGKFLIHKHQPQIVHRQRGFALDVRGSRFVGQKGEEQSEFTSGADDILI
jgi:hypothetical protein